MAGEEFVIGLFAVFVVVVLVVFGVAVFFFLKIAKRSAKLEKDLTQNFLKEGFMLDYAPSRNLLTEFKGFLLFQITALRQRIHYILTGTYAGREWKILKYSYSLPTDGGISSHNFLVFLTHPRSRLPNFYLANNVFVNKPILKTNNYSEVSFNDEEFSKKYFVLAENPEDAQLFFNEQLREFLKEKTSLDFMIEAYDNTVIAYLRGQIAKLSFSSNPIVLLQKASEILEKFESQK
ncbi:MAG: hypothetical protein JW772_01745 [Candidatus Diapherotrites archaeon]|nr:hypothetical protein [Candidatus Diapherotrites archaeon]